MKGDLFDNWEISMFDLWIIGFLILFAILGFFF
jgi:hypothetical protein